MRHIALFFLAVVVISALAGGCGRRTDHVGSRGKADTGFPITVNDSVGRVVCINREPKRLVSLAPSNTEILFALGLGDRVVGVTKYCDYPPEATQKEKVGGFSDPNIEKVVSLSPDVVFATTMHREQIPELERLGIPIVVLHAATLDGVIENIMLVGETTGRLGEARNLAEKIRERRDRIGDRLKGIPEEKRPRVYYEVFSEPIMSAGPNTLIHNLITLAGGRNIAADANTDYPQYSLEVLVKKDPQVIIVPDVHGTDATTIEKIRTRPGWGNISAIREGRVYVIDDDLITIPGPRAVEGLEAVARTLYPDRFQSGSP